jgi:hypothetical protein
VGGNFHFHDGAVALAVSPDAPVLQRGPGRGEHAEQVRDIFHRPNVLDRHAEKFGSTVPVLFDGGFVDVQVPQRLAVIDEQRVGDRIEQEEIVVLRVVVDRGVGGERGFRHWHALMQVFAA